MTSAKQTLSMTLSFEREDRAGRTFVVFCVHMRRRVGLFGFRSLSALCFLPLYSLFSSLVARGSRVARGAWGAVAVRVARRAWVARLGHHVLVSSILALQITADHA